MYEDTHKTVEGVEYKLCKGNCGEWYPMNEDYFYKAKANKTDGYYTYCKKCATKKALNNRNKNRDENLAKMRVYGREYMRRPDRKIKQRENSKNMRKKGVYKSWVNKNKDKIKQYRINKSMHHSHSITKEEWNKCKEYFNNECAYCGLPIVEHYITYKGQRKLSDFHKEHVYHDGSNDLSNCVPACRDCNSYKWKFKLEEWYNESNENYTEERLNKINKWINEDYKLHIKEK